MSDDGAGIAGLVVFSFVIGFLFFFSILMLDNIPSMSDNERKDIWCGALDFDQPYSFDAQGNDYCGDTRVDMKCIFESSGDFCRIIPLGNQTILFPEQEVRE
jgi:hypothetical protein